MASIQTFMEIWLLQRNGRLLLRTQELSAVAVFLCEHQKGLSTGMYAWFKLSLIGEIVQIGVHNRGQFADYNIAPYVACRNIAASVADLQPLLGDGASTAFIELLPLDVIISVQSAA